MKKMPHYPPTMKLRRHEALHYLNVGGTTMDSYVREGKIAPVSVSPTNPNAKFYLVADLDRMKAMLGARAGKRLGRRATVAISALADALPESADSPYANIPLEEIDSVQARLMEAVGIPPSVSLHKGQTLLRQHILTKAIQSKVVEKLFDGLDNPDTRVQQVAIKSILQMILPQLKTVENIKVDNPDDAERTNALKQAIEMLHSKIHHMRLEPPTITMDGVRIIDVA